MGVVKILEFIVEAELINEGVWLDHHLTEVAVHSSVAAGHWVVWVLYRPTEEYKGTQSCIVLYMYIVYMCQGVLKQNLFQEEGAATNLKRGEPPYYKTYRERQYPRGGGKSPPPLPPSSQKKP